MIVTALLPVRLAKEVHGLLLAWLAAAVSMGTASALGGPMRAVGLVAYFIGATALGALSVGQEYNHRTMTLLLAQPTRRARVWLDKFVVLTAMLLALAAIAGPWLFDSDLRRELVSPEGGFGWTVMFGLPIICGLFLAPWMTLVCRNTLAGIVFALAIPATLWGSSEWITSWIYVDLAHTTAARALVLDLFVRGVLIAAALGGVFSWRLFMRLEAIESRGLEVRLPAWFQTPASKSLQTTQLRQNVLWLLLKKELRLQQLTFAVSVLYVVSWVGIVTVSGMSPEVKTTLLFMMTLFHCAAVTVLAGSLASAEERQLGTIEWQSLMPLAGWKQWAVKAGASLTIALTLSFGLPALLLSLNASPELRGELPRLVSPGVALVIVPTVVAALYISSLSANGLRAVLLSVPIILGVMSAFSRLFPASIRRSPSDIWQRWARFYRYGAADFDGGLLLYRGLADGVALIVYLGIVLLLLRLALRNHRSAERGSRRVWNQVGGIGAFVIAGAILAGGADRLYANAFDERVRIEKSKWAAVTGIVIDENNRPVRNYTVMLFAHNPVPGRFGTRRIFSAGANRRDRFAVDYLPPGRYWVIAVPRLPDGMWSDPRLLGPIRTLAERTEPISLEVGTTRSLTLTLAGFDARSR